MTMEVKDYRMGEQLGVLLVYELPDTIKMKETEAQSYVAVMDLVSNCRKNCQNPLFIMDKNVLKKKASILMNLEFFFHLHIFQNDWKNILRQRRRLFINIKNNLSYNL